MPDRKYSAGTRAALFYLSQGTCYFPNCDFPIIRFLEGEPHIDVQIAHIKDLNPGNRYDPSMTEFERNRFTNLVLLCKPHHDEVDKTNASDYSSSDLTAWKNAREEDYTRPLKQLGSIESASQILEMTVEAGAIVHLGGAGGSAPGAGGGGGGAMGPYSRGGHGGAGGKHISAWIELDESVKGLEIDPGQPGLGGSDGNAGQRTTDTTVQKVFVDDTKEEVLRVPSTRGGVARGDYPDGETRVTASLFCNYAEIREGLVMALGIGWDRWICGAFPCTIGASAIYKFAGLPKGGQLPLQLNVFTDSGHTLREDELFIREDEEGRGRTVAIMNFHLEIDQPCFVTVELRSEKLLNDMSFEILGLAVESTTTTT